MHAARIGPCHPEQETAQRQFLAGFGQMADGGGDQAADGVVLVVREVGAEAFVEVGDGRQRIHHELAVGLRGDQRGTVLGFVVLVVDLAHDLFQHVLDGHQAGDAAVLVHHDRHVVARQAEFLQQQVQLLRFGNQYRRPQQLAHGAGTVVGHHPAQQVLGQQDAQDLVLVVAVDGEARMAGFHHLFHQVQEARLHRQRHHLRARHHHVAHGQVGHGDGAFHHLQGVAADQPVGLRVAQQLHQVVACAGFAGERRTEAVQPGAPLLRRFVGAVRRMGTVVF